MIHIDLIPLGQRREQPTQLLDPKYKVEDDDTIHYFHTLSEVITFICKYYGAG